jgi:hypothetical protein
MYRGRPTSASTVGSSGHAWNHRQSGSRDSNKLLNGVLSQVDIARGIFEPGVSLPSPKQRAAMRLRWCHERRPSTSYR